MGNLVAGPTIAHGIHDRIFGDKEIDRKIAEYQEKVARHKSVQSEQSAEEEAHFALVAAAGEVHQPGRVLPYLFLGDLTAVTDVDFLRSLRIGHVLQCNTEPTVPQVNENVRLIGAHYTRLPIPDEDTYNIILDFEQSNAIIAAGKVSHAAGDDACNVLVFCERGVSRSATLVIAYLMKECDYTLKAAIRSVRMAKRDVFPNKGFFNQLVEYEKTLKGKNSVTEQDYDSLFA